MGDLFYRKHWTVEKPKAVILLIHGAAEHCERYDHVGQWFNQQGISLYSGDLPGHGKSPGKKGDIESFQQYISTANLWWDEITSLIPQVPHYLMGHSMGGLVAARLMETTSLSVLPRGVILSSPLFELQLEVPEWKDKMARLIRNIYPQLQMPSGIQPEQVSRDPQVVQSYARDPLISHKVSIRWYIALQKEMKQLWEEISSIPDVPFLILQAGTDKLVKPEAAERFYQQLPVRRKELKILPDLYHEILNEPEKEEVLQMIRSWAESLQ
ncbi:lysophospholipase [Microaerobacter geothermalis]|uniref:alpha/beta hydrolase n=1 Tax=Microaerobacter geothermalis TaxID=674972 RepID=UPI001F2CA13A|nr:alpha/beta hydrolase [Microaerobacter geothermalis]MCF6094144.1 lysophospholipase [Microaerobacter geothermalis]